MTGDSPQTERPGVIALLVVLVVAFPVLLIWGDGQWFGLDEWSFIANRRLPSVDGFFGDHNGHWVTIPLVVFRINFALFGLHSYVPYQALVILSHLAIAGLSHTIMRRAGVRSWIATALVIGFVFYGAGWGNILFAFQISLNGSVLAGLIQFVAADHEGRWSRRDTVGVGVAVMGLMTSAVMPAMSIGVGAFVLVRRGWRVAAGHTVPPAAVFLIWFVGFGGADDSDPHVGRIIRFVYHMIRATFEGFGGSVVAGAALALVAALGLASSTAAWRRTGDARFVALPVGLVTGVLAFSALTGYNRSGFDADIPSAASQGRYLHVCAALLLPVVALGAQQLWEWRRPLVALPIVLVALGLPGNIDTLRDRGPYTTGNRDLFIAVAHSDLLDRAPGSLRPLPLQDVRVAWIRHARDEGDLPGMSDDISVRARLDADTLLAFAVADTTSAACVPTDAPTPVEATLRRGDQIVVGGPVRLLLVDGEDHSTPRALDDGTTVTIQAGPVDVVVRGVDDAPPIVCIAASDS